jgi:hypothetical protein
MSKFMFESNWMVRGRILPDIDCPARAEKRGSIVSKMSRRPGAFGVKSELQV